MCLDTGMKKLRNTFLRSTYYKIINKIDWTFSRKAYVSQLCMAAQVYTATAHTFFLEQFLKLHIKINQVDKTAVKVLHCLPQTPGL